MASFIFPTFNLDILYYNKGKLNYDHISNLGHNQTIFRIIYDLINEFTVFMLANIRGVNIKMNSFEIR